MKTFLRKCLLLIAMLAPVCGLSAEEVTATFEAATDKNPVNNSFTKNDVTISLNGSGTLNNGSEYRIFSGSTFKVSYTGGVITKIDFTSTANGSASNGLGKFNSPSVGSFTYETSAKTGTWTAQESDNVTEVTFSNSGQVRLTSVVVTVIPGGGSTEPIEPTTSSNFKYVMITSNDELEADGRYIIANLGNSKAMQAYVSGNNHKTTSITYKDNTIEEVGEGTAELLLKPQDGGRYAFLETNIGKYLAITTSNYASKGSNNLKTSNDIDADFTNASITIAENGDATIQFDVNSTYTRNTLQYNSSSTLFSCYSSSQQPVQMFRAIYTRDVTSGNYGTICLPYAGTVEGATLYVIDGKQMNGENPESISLTKAETIEAGKPYIFKATADQLVVKLKGEEVTTAGSENGLIGSYEGMNVEVGKYVINSNQVKKCGANSKIGANRCYIDMDAVPAKAASANAVILSFDDTATAIEDIQANAAGKSAIYDLSGRRVKTAKKGLYIVNGKKVIK